MSVASPKLPPTVSVPIDPRALRGTTPAERGQAYGNLYPCQRQAVEEALRLVEAGDYPPPSQAAAVEHLRRERAAREALGQPRRHR